MERFDDRWRIIRGMFLEIHRPDLHKKGLYVITLRDEGIPNVLKVLDQREAVAWFGLGSKYEHLGYRRPDDEEMERGERL